MRNNKNIRLLAIHRFLVGFIPFAPVAILYFQKVSGSFGLGMSVFSIAMFSTALFEVPTGVLSDKIGRKLTVVLGSLSYLLAYIFYAIGYSYIWLVLGAILAGLGRAFYSGNNDALLYDTLREYKKEDKLDHYLGKISSSEHASLAISALLGGAVAHFSFSLAMWLSTLPQLINVIISFGFYEPEVRTKKLSGNVYAHLKDSFKVFVKNKRLFLLTLAGTVSFGIGEALWQFKAAFVEQLWPIWAIGIISVLSNIGAGWSYYYSGILIKKYGMKFVIVAGKIYSRVMMVIAYGFPTVISPILITTPSLFYGVGWTARVKLFQKEFTDSQRATMDSIRSFAYNIGFGVLSLVIGFSADLIGVNKTFLISQVFLVIPIVLYLKFFKDRKNIG